MPSLLEIAIDQFRERLLAADQETLAVVVEAYQETRAELMGRIDALTAAMEDGAPVGEVLRSERARALLRQVEAEMAALAIRMQPVVTSGQATAASLAAEQSLALAVVTAAASNEALAVRVAAGWNRLNAGAVEALVGRLSDGSPLSDWMAQFGTDAAEIMKRELTVSVALGRNPRATAARLAKMVDVSGARLMLLTRDAQLNAYRDASRQAMIANDDILDGYMRIGALSDRTCAACLALHGTVYQTSHLMETHNGCRCSMVPLVKGVARPEIESGEAWFDAQSEDAQRKVIGIAGQNAYAHGRVALDDFVKRDEDERWGASYRQSSLTDALASARSRDRRAA